MFPRFFVCRLRCVSQTLSEKTASSESLKTGGVMVVPSEFARLGYSYWRISDEKVEVSNKDDSQLSPSNIRC